MNSWIVINESVIGASHLLSQKPNQDCIKSIQATIKDVGDVVVLSLADGHGGERYIRSDIGASIAVDIALQESISLLENHPLIYFEELLIRELPKKLTEAWKKSIYKYHSNNAFTVEEQQKLNSIGISQPEKIHDYPFFIYGCTLMIVILTNDYIIYVKLGDGDILCVNQMKETYYPLMAKEELIANETYSLCMNNAEAYFSIMIENLMDDRKIPELIMVSSDGYKNSFEGESGFFKAALDYFDMFDGYPARLIEKNLNRFLTDTTKNGSGDDISLGLIKRNSIHTFDMRKQLFETTRRQSDIENTLQRNYEIVEHLDNKLATTTNLVNQLLQSVHENEHKAKRELLVIQEEYRIVNQEIKNQEKKIILIEKDNIINHKEISIVRKIQKKLQKEIDEQEGMFNKLQEKNRRQHRIIILLIIDYIGLLILLATYIFISF